MRELLRDRNLRLLFISRTVSSLSDALMPVALSLAIIKATGSTTDLALVLACAVGTRLLLLPLAGVLADRLPVRLAAMGADASRAVVQAIVGFQLLSGRPDIALIAAVEFVAGAASAVSLASMVPLAAGVMSPDKRSRGNALIGMGRSVALLFGPAIAGTLVLTAGAGWVFLIDASAFALSALLLCFIRVVRIPTERHSVRADLVEGWSEVRIRDWFWTTLIAHASINFADIVLVTLGPLVASRNLGGEGVWVAVVQAGGVGLLLGSVLAHRVRPRRPVLVGNIALASYAVPLVLFAMWAPPVLVVLSYGLAWAAMGFLNPVWDTTVQAMIPEHALAKVSSYDWLVSLGAQPLALIAAPLAASAWGTRLPLAATAAIVAVACLGTAAVPGVRNLRLS